MPTVCYVVREKLRLDTGVVEENLWINRVKINGREVDVDQYAIISFDPLTNPQEQKEVVILSIDGVINLGLPKDFASLLESIKRIIEDNPKIIESIEVHVPREWLMKNCEVIVIGEEEDEL